MSSHLLPKLQHILNKLQLQIPEETQTKLIDYLALLARWNQVYNLTAIRDPDEMLTKHIADSLSVAPYLHGKRFIDVGSGAGLPGMVLAMIFPQQKWTLLDSNGKKTRFLLHAKINLGLENVEVVQSRVETYTPEACFDGVITRAWTSISEMLTTTQQLYCKDAKLWAMKGKYPEEELAALPEATFTVYKLDVPGLGEQRHLVCINVPSLTCGRGNNIKRG